MLTVSIIHWRNSNVLAILKNMPENMTILDVKNRFCEIDNKYKLVECSVRCSPDSKALADNTLLNSLPIVGENDKLTLYYKNLGPQVGWKTVFFVEYAGPAIIYTLFFLQRQFLPTSMLSCSWLQTIMPPIQHDLCLRNLAFTCYVGHFLKRLLETVFVHRFSHATMPRRNIIKNCSYYWLFAVLIAYYTNHHLYTFPSFGWIQVYIGLGVFLVGEMGNFACHMAFRNLRPPGSKVRAVPRPVAWSPFTQLFRIVACPNYTYEVMAWCGFTIMTQTLPALLFTFFGGVQMSLWALAKLKAYRKEFKHYPKKMKAIFPFVL